jgi:Domain of unknown function (DUF4349)
MKTLLVAVLMLAAAVACGGGGLQSASNTAGKPVAGPAQPATGGSKAGTGAPDTSGGGATLPETVPALQGPPVIRQAQLSITVGNGLFGSKLSEVRALVESQGGYIAGTDAQAAPVADTLATASPIRTGVITFMVPAANFDGTVDQLTRVGKLQGEHITGTDVSAQYVDLRARLANAQAQLTAMRALLAKATSINDIITVQNQIGQITSQIEQLEGQIKYLDDHTAYSSISVTLTESGAPARTQPADTWGFMTAVDQAAHNFVTTIDYLIALIGALGPVILAGLGGWYLWRRRRVPAARHA